MKEVAEGKRLKMPQLVMPLRLAVTGQTQTPAIDAMLELLGRDTVLARLLAAQLDQDVIFGSGRRYNPPPRSGV